MITKPKNKAFILPNSNPEIRKMGEMFLDSKFVRQKRKFQKKIRKKATSISTEQIHFQFHNTISRYQKRAEGKIMRNPKSSRPHNNKSKSWKTDHIQEHTYTQINNNTKILI